MKSFALLFSFTRFPLELLFVFTLLWVWGSMLENMTMLLLWINTLMCVYWSIVLMNYCCVDIHFRLPNIPSRLRQSPFLCPWDCEKMGMPLLIIVLFCHHPNKDLHNTITMKRYPKLCASLGSIIHCYTCTCRYQSTCWASTWMSTQTLHGMLSSTWWVINNA